MPTATRATAKCELQAWRSCGKCWRWLPKLGETWLESLLLEVDVRSAQGATALMFAADAGDKEVCHLLLWAGADVTATDEDGDDAKAWAKARGHRLQCLSP